MSSSLTAFCLQQFYLHDNMYNAMIYRICKYLTDLLYLILSYLIFRANVVSVCVYQFTALYGYLAPLVSGSFARVKPC